MARLAANAASMEKGETTARAGMLYAQPKILHPGYRLFRFATKTYSSDWLTNGWWIGFSPFEGVTQLAHRDDKQFGAVARAALAIFIDPRKRYHNEMDVLLWARVEQRLAAWTGTPKTVTIRTETGVARWEPDRTITQLYIPGLEAISPPALSLLHHEDVPANKWKP